MEYIGPTSFGTKRSHEGTEVVGCGWVNNYHAVGISEIIDFPHHLPLHSRQTLDVDIVSD